MRVFRSRAKVSVPPTLTARKTVGASTSYTTPCPARMWTRAPALGTLPPSHVAGADQAPLLALRSHAASWASRSDTSATHTATANSSDGKRIVILEAQEQGGEATISVEGRSRTKKWRRGRKPFFAKNLLHDLPTSRYDD